MKNFYALLIFVFAVLLSGCDAAVEVEEEIIIDISAPVISLVGEADIYLNIGDEFTDPGATVNDDIDLAPTLIVSGNDIDTSSSYLFTIYYNAFDEAGNLATEVVRRVHVVNDRPGVITSFTYESVDLIGVSVMVFDFDNVLVDLYANLYNGEVLIDSVEITESSQSFQFTGLESGIDYQLVVEGTFELGCGQDVGGFKKPPITVGVYRRIGEDLRSEINNDVKFDALQDMIYLPYDNSNYTKSKEMIMTLANIDEDLLTIYNDADFKIIFSNTWINSLYEFFELRDFDNIPATFGEPSALYIGYSGTSIDISLRTMAELFGYRFNYNFLTIEYFDAFNAEKDNLFISTLYTEDEYYYFFESFAFYYYSETSRQALLENAPLTYAFLETLISDTIENCFLIN